MRPIRFRFRLWMKPVFLSTAVFAALAFQSCAGDYRERIPTGVQRVDAPDGTIQLIATGMASKNSIEKDNTAMMQATSKEAARLLLMAELSEPRYAQIKDRFEMNEVEFIDRGRYCRMTAVYRPPGPARR